jgi:predicted neuraminidase
VLWREGESLLLYFKVGIYPKRWRTYVCVGSLEAGGPRWSEARELVPGDVGGRGPVKNKPIRLAEGVFLCGASLENDAGWDCFAERSHDGLVWEASPLVPRDESIPGRGIIQPTLWEISPSHVAMLCRSNAGCLVRSDSRDAGRTWEGARTTALPNNGSGVDLATLADGSLLLASNPVSDAWGARTPLTLQRSRDKGETWSQVAVLAEGPGEFSYPAVVASGKGALVSYTHDRREIRVVRWEPDA